MILNKSYLNFNSSKLNLESTLRFLILNFLLKSKVNSEVESNFVLEKSKFSKLLLKINKISSLLILFFLFFKFPFTKNLSFFFLIIRCSELKFILLKLNKIFLKS